MSTRAPLLIALSVLAVGCSCRKETGFSNVDEPGVDETTTGDDDDDDDDGEEPEGDSEPSDWGTWLSADVGPDGERMSVAYYDPNREAVGYAQVRFDEAGDAEVRFERVDGYEDDDNDVGRYASQITASDGTAWVAYHDADDGELKLRHRTAVDEWATVETVGVGGIWADLSEDPEDRLVVAHTSDDGVLRLSRRVGTSWETNEIYQSVATDWTLPDGTVVTRPAEVAYPRVLTDSGKLYIAFYDKAQGELHLMSGVANNLADSVVRGSGDDGAWPSLMVHNGQMHIAFQDVANEDLVLAVQTGSGWSFDVVDDGALVGADTELFLHDGKVQILYFNGFESDLWLATDDGSWSLQRLEGGASAVGFHNETVDLNGQRMVGSYDYTNRAVVFLPL